MTQSAMSANSWDRKLEPFSSELDEWLYFKNDFNNQNVNDSLLKLTRHEIADRILHEIEDLGRNNNDDWLNEFPLFEEIQILKSVDEFENVGEEKNGDCASKHEQEQISPNDVFVVPEIFDQPLENKDLFSVFNENTATFILSNENILYIKNEPFVTLQQDCVTVGEPAKEKIPSEEQGSGTSENVNTQSDLLWTNLDVLDDKMEMAVVDEIIRNRALELDQWESDSSRSDTSSNSTTASDFSPKEKEKEEEEEESDDPDWKPNSLLELGRKKCAKRSKPYWRGGNQEEKKLRKKEQNKNAATRYRLKKKAEVNEILREEESLKEKKAKLEEKMADIQSEIKCVKALMRDLFKAKGIIN